MGLFIKAARCLNRNSTVDGVIITVTFSIIVFVLCEYEEE